MTLFLFVLILYLIFILNVVHFLDILWDFIAGSCTLDILWDFIT